MWKRVAILLGIYINFRGLPFPRRADGFDYELMLAECRKRGWESCDELKETLDCSRRIIEEISNPDELKRLREKEVEKLLQENPELTRRKLEEADTHLAESGKRRFRARKTYRGAHVSYRARSDPSAFRSLAKGKKSPFRASKE